MENSRFTEKEIEKIVENMDKDFGLFVTFFMNKHNYNGVDIKACSPIDGTEYKFELRRVERFEDEEEITNEKL